ncbi:GNAT family N-acetyltransferase [Vacuolonema iberomarrocanum]|uniref:GNAT family N-acetyltransferase n=1 Tax=Vacuolonema iberomarrocanum TaxID=3454632 RepID=UPI001A07C470|nr:GNAT family N-acetyltransferase [filamentous cyanobacterium LEGE 07170]
MADTQLSPTFYWSRLEDLSGREVHEIIKAREAVFIVEQNCPYQEADDYDLNAWHLVCRVDGNLAAYIRVVDPGLKYPEPSIGRVMTVKEFRGKRLGALLMQEAIQFTENKYPLQGIQIGAQAYLRDFYTALGFHQVGEDYLEDNIPHINMVKPG